MQVFTLQVFRQQGKVPSAPAGLRPSPVRFSGVLGLQTRNRGVLHDMELTIHLSQACQAALQGRQQRFSQQYLLHRAQAGLVQDQVGATLSDHFCAGFCALSSPA